MRKLTRRAAMLAGAAVAALVLGVVLLVGETWLAARGPKAADPPPAPRDLAAGPPVPAGGAGPSGASAGGEVPVVVWLGDSTAAGVGASSVDATVAEQVAYLVGEPIRLTVLARSGARVADALRLQLPQVAGLHPSEVFISVGANDAVHLTSRPSFRRDYGRLLDGLPASVRRVVLLGVPDMGAPPRLLQPLRLVAGWRGRALDSDVRHLAGRRHLTYVDIAAGTGPAFRHQSGRYFAADHYHPNDAGYRLWAAAVAAAIKATP